MTDGPDGLHGATAPGPAVMDLSMLTAMAGGDAQTLADLIAEFRRSSDADTAMLRRAVSDADLAQAATLAHRLQGACAMLGAERLQDACGRVRAAARDADARGAAAAMARFESEWLAVNGLLDRRP